MIYADVDKSVISAKDVVSILQNSTFRELKKAVPELRVQLSGELE